MSRMLYIISEGRTECAFVKNKAGKSGFSWKIAQAVGIQRIRHECPHFNEWLTKLETYE